jgi:replication-associated recombination protein RarA
MFESIIGQKLITKELTAIAKHVEAKKVPTNILLRGPAGSGKTYIAETFLYTICGDNFSRQLPANSNDRFIFPNGIQHLFGHFVD